MVCPKFRRMSVRRKVSTALRIRSLFSNWLLLYADKLGLMRGDRLVEAMFRDGRVLCYRRQTDRVAFGENLLVEAYDHPALRWPDFNTVLDIGANIGCFCLWMAGRNRRASYILVEPNPGTLPLLKMNLSRNPSLRTQVIEQAVAGKTGQIEFFVDRSNAGESGIRATPGHAAERIMVPAVSMNDLLDALPTRQVDLIKIDCEGAEFELFDSLPKESWLRISNLVMETHAVVGREPEELIDRLRTCGFRTHRHGINPFLVWATRG